MIKRPVDFVVRGRRAAGRKGTGYTLNLSPKGVLLSTGSDLSVGERIDLVVHLGDALGGPHINFQREGRVVRKEDGAVAVKILKGSLSPQDKASTS